MELNEFIKPISLILSGVLGLFGYMDITKKKGTKRLSIIGKIGLLLLLINIILLVSIELHDSKSNYDKAIKEKKDYESLLDSLNDIINHTKRNFQLIDSVKSNLKKTEASISENLILQKQVSIQAERLLSPISNMDFLYSLTYELEDTTYIEYINYLKLTIDSILTRQVPAQLDIDKGIHSFAIDSFPYLTSIELIDSTYFYKGSSFKIFNNSVDKIYVGHNSELLPTTINRVNKTLSEVNMYVIFDNSLRKGERKYEEMLMLQVSDKKIKSDYLENNLYLNTSDYCRLSLIIDFAEKKIIKDVKQPFVNIRHKGSKIKSYKDLSNKEIWIKDNNIALKTDWLPSPLSISNFTIIINNSVYIKYDSTYQLQNPQNLYPLDYLKKKQLE